MQVNDYSHTESKNIYKQNKIPVAPDDTLWS